MQETEQREHPRHSLVGFVDYVGSAGVTILEMKDVSQGGLRLLVSSPERPGTRVSLLLRFLGSEANIEVEALVMWSRTIEPYEMGVQFLSLPERYAGLMARAFTGV